MPEELKLTTEDKQQLESIKILERAFEEFTSFVIEEVNEDWVGKAHFKTLVNAFKYSEVMRVKEAVIEQLKAMENPMVYAILVRIELGVNWRELVENFPFAEVLFAISNTDMLSDLIEKNEKRKALETTTKGD